MLKYSAQEAEEPIRRTSSQSATKSRSASRVSISDNDVTKLTKENLSDSLVSKKRTGSQIGSGFDLNGWVKEVFRYCIFLLAFTLSIFDGRGSDQTTAYTGMWRDILQSQTSNVSTTDGILHFLQNTLVEQFLISDDYFAQDNWTKLGEYGEHRGSAFVGNIRVRQLRVNGAPCSSTHKTFEHLGLITSKQCFPHWSPGSESTRYDFAGTDPQLIDIHKYVSADLSARNPMTGRFGTYHGGGFVAELNVLNASTLVSKIANFGWIDRQTRVVSVDFLLYSPNIDLFALCSVLFELAPGNVVFPSFTILAIFPNRYPLTNVGDYFKMLYEVVVYFMVCFYIYEETMECRNIGPKKYFAPGWNYLDILNLFLLLVAGYYKVNCVAAFSSTFGKSGTDVGPVQVASIGNTIVKMDQVNGINGLLLWLKIFKYVAITRRLRRLAQTVFMTLLDVANWAVLFIVFAMAFSVAGFVFFHQLDIFGSVGDALMTIFRTMYGDSQYAAVSAVSRSGYLFLLLWLFVSRTVLLNIVIAIFYHSYVTVRSSDEIDPTATDLDRIVTELRRRADIGEGFQGRVLRFVFGTEAERRAAQVIVVQRRKASRIAAAQQQKKSMAAADADASEGDPGHRHAKKGPDAAMDRLGWLTGTAQWQPWARAEAAVDPVSAPATTGEQHLPGQTMDLEMSLVSAKRHR